MSTPADLAHRLRQAMSETETTPPQLAALCGVRVPSVYGWMRTGRIAKKHLSVLARHFGKPLPWWLGLEQDDEDMLSQPERELLAAFRLLQPALQQRLLDDAELLKKLQQPAGPPPPPPIGNN